MTGLDRPVFVVGCPRSGTTLVQCILSASSQAFSLPETHFFSWVLPVLGLQPGDAADPSVVQCVRQELASEAQLSLPTEFWSRLEATTKLSVSDVFVAVVEHFRPADGLRAIEKTPRHVLHLDTLGEVFPDALFVNVVRNPVDVSSSLQGVPFESSRSMLSHAQRWLESIQAARTYAATHSSRICTIVYERLVREPDAEVRRLCGFVELAYEPAMLEEFGREAARNVIAGAEAWKGDVSSGVIVDRQGVWRSRLTPGQAWLVAQATSGARHEYGYPAVRGASAASIVSATCREAFVRFREARSSTGVVGAARHASSVLRTLAAT
jgi:hypothetical protein